MRYRSFVDLSKTVQENLYRLPSDIDLVIGIPRSGMLPASMIALGLNLPLADLDGFVEGRILASGHTRRIAQLDKRVEEFRRILIVDDSILSGGSMRKARERVAALPNPERFLFCAVYSDGDMHVDADIVFEDVPPPRIFQWNLIHHQIVTQSCFDIDGVLCFDPTHEENDDGERYTEFLTNARSLMLPSHKIAHLVTSRLERYRPQTEAWLAAKGVKYDKLWMLDLPTAEARRKAGAHGSFKADVYKKVGAKLFIESEERQAIEIARLSGKPVLSLETHTMVDPSRAADILQVFEQRSRGLKRRLKSERLYRTIRNSKKMIRRMLGR